MSATSFGFTFSFDNSINAYCSRMTPIFVGRGHFPLWYLCWSKAHPIDRGILSTRGSAALVAVNEEVKKKWSQSVKWVYIIKYSLKTWEIRKDRRSNTFKHELTHGVVSHIMSRIEYIIPTGFIEDQWKIKSKSQINLIYHWDKRIRTGPGAKHLCGRFCLPEARRTETQWRSS